MKAPSVIRSRMLILFVSIIPIGILNVIMADAKVMLRPIPARLQPCSATKGSIKAFMV